MKKDSNLVLITLAAFVLGLDYIWNLLPGLPGFFSLNRFVFLGIFAADVLLYPGKYLRSMKIYLVCLLIIIGCLPFLILRGDVFGGNSLSYMIELLGVFAYLIFFYFNCSDSRTAGRISNVLFLSSGVIVIYVIGSHLGLFGSKITGIRAGVEYTRASGVFDPNMLTVNFLPIFAFGPLLMYRWRRVSGRLMNLFVMIYICICFVAFFTLNSRAGSVAVIACLGTSLIMLFIIVPRWQKTARIRTIFFIVIMVAVLTYVHLKYNVLGTIIAIYEGTELSTDRSFSSRLTAYRYLKDDLYLTPDIFGAGYQAYWKAEGWEGFRPHCAFADVYIKGGLLFLLTYIYLFLGGMIKSFSSALKSKEIALKSCFAGFFCFLVGFMPLAITLSVEGKKLPWAIMGCIFGLAIARSNKYEHSPSLHSGQ